LLEPWHFDPLYAPQQAGVLGRRRERRRRQKRKTELEEKGRGACLPPVGVI